MNDKRSHGELIRRYVCFLVGLEILALGIAFSIQADLGTSPISSVPYVVSLIIPLSVGTLTILLHTIFLLLQILILRRRFRLIQLSQLLVALVFGGLTDLSLSLIQGVTPTSYGQQWMLCVIGILLVAVGVSLEVTADVVVLAGEGLTLALSSVLPLKFSTLKSLFDVSLAATACIISLTCLHSLHGVREGTLAAAVFVGVITKPLIRFLSPRCKAWFTMDKANPNP